MAPGDEEAARESRVDAGPEDEPDPSVNGDPSSLSGEEDESGYDDMPVDNGWEDESDDEGDEDDDC